MGIASRFKGSFVGDVFAGLSLALVIIPQSLAYAQLAGLPAYTGLLATALPSIAAALFVPSPYLQPRPMALTSLLSFGVLSQLATPGTTDYIALATSLALFVGVFRVLIGVFRFGPIVYLISQPVLMGFTTAAALLILSSQLPKSLGVEIAEPGMINGAIYSLSHPQAWFIPTVLLALASVVIMVLGMRFNGLFPGVLVVTVLGLLVTALLPYHGVTIGEIPSVLPTLTFHLPWTHLPQITLGGFIIALVGFAEPASIARRYAALDKIPWSANREFISQGVANLTAGLVGGFPVGGAFSRTSRNWIAGVNNRVRGLITGGCVLAFVPFSHLLSGLPVAVLGAIVIAAVLRSLNFTALWRLRDYSRPQAYIAWFTFVACLVLAPRIDIAILLGIGITVAHHLRREQQVVIDSSFDDRIIYIQPKGVLWFGSIANFEAAFQSLLTQHQSVEQVVLNLKGLGRIDLSAAISLQRLIKTSRESGLNITLENIPPMAMAWSKRLWQEELNRPA